MLKQIAILMFTAIAVISAENTFASSPSSDKLERALRKEITYPEFAKSEQLFGLVLVEFEVLPTGKVQVNKINTSHENLGSYVKSELEKISVEDLNEIGKHYVKFKFRFVEV
jgi:hypothetical protein